LFFAFFTVDQLTGNMPDGKKMFEMRSNAGGVTVVLRIPVKQSYIEYSRTYFTNNVPNITKNEGALVEDDFVFALFPSIKFENDKDAFYRFGLISAFNNSNNYDVQFYANEIKKAELVIRNENNSEYRKSKNYVFEKSNFNYIRIQCANNCSGIVIPNFTKQGGTDQYTFAIDFGTTNTHVEYSVNGLPSKPFDISANDKQIQLFAQDYDSIERYIFDYDYIPEVAGVGEEFKFPMRTALSEARNANWNLGVLPLAHANIAFPYEKRVEYKYNRITTGLKWSNETDNIKRVLCYIESLFLILRNKVILNNGDLSKTKIVWFYPISMTRNRFNLFKQVWDNAYQKYFGDNLQNIITITESVAPYEHYKRTIGNASDMVSIDIGGGTSDIVIAVEDEVKYITSFRFAANTIFGDGYADNNTNGIIRQFKDPIYKILKEAGMTDLMNIYADLDGKNVSSDLASFLFSLKNNKKIIEKHLSDSVDFNKILQTDDTQKIIFVFFYVAIVYHLAHIMKAKNLPMPRHITFSGNGSKVIQILTTDNRLLEDFTKLIFEKIYKTSYSQNGLTILQNTTNPKEATCKGGISSQTIQDYGQISSTKVILSGADNQSFISNETYGGINTDEYLAKTVNEVHNFIDFVIGLNSDFSYKKNFGIDTKSFKIAKEACYRDLETYAKKGLGQKLAEVSGEDTIEETFFFYPLNGMLNALSTTIHENK
jgi:hypothetical protein